MRSRSNRIAGIPTWARFIVAGGLAALVNWAVRFPLSAWLPYLPAVVLATAIGMAFGFVTYRAFVFEPAQDHVAVQIRSFILVNLISMLLVAAIALAARSLLLLIVPLTAAEAFAHAVGIGCGAIANFIGHSTITFKRSGGHMRRPKITAV